MEKFVSSVTANCHEGWYRPFEEQVKSKNKLKCPVLQLFLFGFFPWGKTIQIFFLLQEDFTKMKCLLEVLLMEVKSWRQPRVLLVKNREVKYRICTKRNNTQEWIKSINGIMSRFQKHNAAMIKDKKCETMAWPGLASWDRASLLSWQKLGSVLTASPTLLPTLACNCMIRICVKQTTGPLFLDYQGPDDRHDQK